MTCSGWLIPFEMLKSGSSAIIGGKVVAFYTVHVAALTICTISLIASLTVIVRILLNWWQGKRKFDVSVRFPLYLSSFDFVWGLANFSGHFYLITEQMVPEEGGANDLMPILSALFFGFTHVSRIGIAVYTYLHVVHGKKWNMGRWEWKLHLIELFMLSWHFPILYSMKAFGFSGYWLSYDASTMGGHILIVCAGVVSTLNGLCTTLGYYGIRKTVLRMKNTMEGHEKKESIVYKQQLQDARTQAGLPRAGQSYNKSLKCLTTYVFTGSLLYCPLAVIYWVNFFIHLQLRCVDPLTSFLIVIGTNSTGWVTACGYFYNEWAKRKYERMCNQPAGYLSLSSLNT